VGDGGPFRVELGGSEVINGWDGSATTQLFKRGTLVNGTIYNANDIEVAGRGSQRTPTPANVE
ncbi:MAG: hypothetical protein AAGA64_09295, partial [Bacteroidota bacterium]